MINNLQLAFGLYALLLLLIGLFFYKKESNANDFLMGDRQLNFWVTAISAHASDMSSWLFMGLPAAIFVHGADKIWVCLGLLIGMGSTWQFLAKPIRVETERFNVSTLPSLIAAKVNAPYLKRLFVLPTLIFYTVYIAAGLYSLGLLMNDLFEIPYHASLILSSILIVSYILLGGYTAVAWTDFFQGLLLLVAIVATPFVFAQSKGLSLPSFSYTAIPLAILPWTLMEWGLGYFGQPHILNKFMGIQKANDIQKAKVLGLSWQLLALGGSALVGLVALSASMDSQPELIFVHMVHHSFPPLLAGFVLCGIISATISTLDSQLLALSGFISCDVLEESSQSSHVMRWSILITMLISIACVWTAPKSLFAMVYYAWTGLGASFGPALLLALYYPKSNGLSLAASLFTGLASSIAFPYLIAAHLPDYITALPFCFCCAALVGLSLPLLRSQSRSK